ncbi:hypothetical protein [Mammaliicoccus sciuri]|uniref:hypothetical protein n=1 Tax=Mammaliicoccus sciuri TaxID=1296 RepID=UPI002DBC2042|nr:hypothetical protein [Mammaliicoccus sciuri]MEB5758262.1 hypothetical protein [Mammaliicoccus sciuri]
MTSRKNNFELLDISDDLLYLSQIVGRIEYFDDENISFVLIELKEIIRKMEKY